jgi:hypothetical protein
MIILDYIQMTGSKWASSDLKWDEEATKYPFNLPTIEGNLYFENEIIVYDPRCLETFEISFDNYIANHPIRSLFPFTKELIMKNMTGILECLQNQARLTMLHNQEYQKKYMLKECLGTPERGYTSKVYLYPNWMIVKEAIQPLETTNHKMFRIMFHLDFDIVQKAENSIEEEERGSLYELIKYIYHNTDNIDIKENIAWSLSKCGHINFLHDLTNSFYSELYSDLILKGT